MESSAAASSYKTVSPPTAPTSVCVPACATSHGPSKMPDSWKLDVTSSLLLVLLSPPPAWELEEDDAESLSESLRSECKDGVFLLTISDSVPEASVLVSWASLRADSASCRYWFSSVKLTTRDWRPLRDPSKVRSFCRDRRPCCQLGSHNFCSILG